MPLSSHKTKALELNEKLEDQLFQKYLHLIMASIADISLRTKSVNLPAALDRKEKSRDIIWKGRMAGPNFVPICHENIETLYVILKVWLSGGTRKLRARRDQSILWQ